jgi:hypothetical protein
MSHSDLDAYLRMLAGERPAGKLLEIRHTHPDRKGMGQVFVPARRPDLATATILRLAGSGEVYVGVLLRTRRRGGRDAVHDSHLLFADIDEPDAQDRLDSFAHPPTATVQTSHGHRHAYWHLTQTLTAAQVPAANRRLAHALGGDPASTDATRILRPPATVWRKREPATAVELVNLDPTRRYPLEELLHALPAPPGPQRQPPARAPRRSSGAVDELLLAIPAADYVHRLTGLEANRAGKVSCPFHRPDRTPSLQLYPDGSWYCFGRCQTGGSVYDFAARLYGITPRGRSFLELRDRLIATLLRDR